MKKILVIALSIALMAFMSASMLVAQEKATTEKEKPACHMEKAAGMKGAESCEKEKASCGGEMKLTPEQKAKVEQLRDDFRLKLVDLKAEREKLAIMLKQEMQKPEPSMQTIEGIVKKMSPVREKIQLATIEHALAMRKLLGPEWRTLMRPEMRGRGMMPGMRGMAGDAMENEGCEGEGNVEREIVIRGGPMAGDEGCPMGATRVLRLRMEGDPSGCSMEKSGMGGGCGMGGMQAGCPMMMHKGAMGGGMGAMKGGCPMMMMHKGAMGGACDMRQGGSCCKGKEGSTLYRRDGFRRYGKNDAGACCCSKGKGAMGGCMMMHTGAMGGCGKESMQGGCKGMKAGAPGEMKCKVEIKKESTE